MDRSWMYRKRDFKFMERLDEFISRAIENQKLCGDEEQLLCPCSLCKNRIKISFAIEMRNHLIMKGFKPDYNVWIWHGEKDNDTNASKRAINRGTNVDNVDDIEIDDVAYSFKEVNEDGGDMDKTIIGDSTMLLEDMNEVKEVWATKCLENM
ncbi:hypothetical protein KSS87_011356 [Heliosperma pusillum]|nr:hypothetical protein KSS87_011356 [Heliosperma pusillum]